MNKYHLEDLDIGKHCLYPWPPGNFTQDMDAAFAKRIRQAASLYGKRHGKTFRTELSRAGITITRRA